MMKRVLFTLSLISTFLGNAQNYQPFKEISSKRFFEAGNPANNDFFFHSTNESLIGDTFLLDQYYSLVDNGNFNQIPECGFWGSAAGVELDTTWLGNQLKWNTSTYQLLLKNEENESLSFDFSLSLGASAPFYSNGTVEYRIEHTFQTLETFYGVSDSVRHYSIQAYDNLGVPTASALNNQVIKLSKNHGLISFVNCYRFPAIEEFVELEGQTNPSIGHYQLTYDLCYPWSIGDVIQYSTNDSYPSVYYKPAYQTLTVTDRIETLDSVTITLSSVVYDLNPSIPLSPFIMGSGPISFKKGTPISEKPWNMNHHDFKLARGSKDSMDWCGPKSSFAVYEEFNGYCDSCRCFGNYDGFGQSITGYQYVEELGQYRYHSYGYGYPTNAGGITAQIVYSNINGVECGTLWNSTDELFLFEWSIYPNPANDFVTVQSDQPIDQIKIVDMLGRTLEILPGEYTFKQEISLASLRKGSYILELTSEEITQIAKFIRE